MRVCIYVHARMYAPIHPSMYARKLTYTFTFILTLTLTLAVAVAVALALAEVLTKMQEERCAQSDVQARYTGA